MEESHAWNLYDGTTEATAEIRGAIQRIGALGPSVENVEALHAIAIDLDLLEAVLHEALAPMERVLPRAPHDEFSPPF